MNETNDSKIIARKWNIVNYNSKSNYDSTNKIAYNTDILKSNLCHYSNAHILIRGDITVVAAPATQLAFKNCAPFTKCITKIDETTIDDVHNLDLVVPMHNLIEYSSNIRKQQNVYGFILKMKQLSLMLILLMIKILKFQI